MDNAIILLNKRNATMVADIVVSLSVRQTESYGNSSTRAIMYSAMSRGLYFMMLLYF